MFVLPADVEVTSDSFLFVLRDPAGNSALPQTYVTSHLACLLVVTLNINEMFGQVGALSDSNSLFFFLQAGAVLVSSGAVGDLLQNL